MEKEKEISMKNQENGSVQGIVELEDATLQSVIGGAASAHKAAAPSTPKADVSSTHRADVHHYDLGQMKHGADVPQFDLGQMKHRADVHQFDLAKNYHK